MKVKIKDSFSKAFKGKRKIIAGLVVLVIISGSIFCLVKGKRENFKDERQINRISERVEKTDFKTTISASGQVMLEDEIEVYAEGEQNKIKSILVEEGDIVKEGDLLIEYDVEEKKEELEKSIRDVKREIENANLSLKSLKSVASQEEIEKLTYQVEAKKKALEEAKNNLESYENKISQQESVIKNCQTEYEKALKDVEDTKVLIEVGGASQSELTSLNLSLEKSEASLKEAQNSYNETLNQQKIAKLSITTAENDLKTAQSELSSAKTPLSTEEEKIKYNQQEIALESLKDKLADYEKDLSELVYYTNANVSGEVTEILVDEGTYTEENTVILKVANFDRLIVSASIEEYDAPELEIGQSVVMTSDGLEGKEYYGKITKIDSSASATSTNMGSETVVPIEISVENPDGILKPGYNLDLEIAIIEKNDILAINSSAIGEENGEKFVYVLENKKAEKRKIELGEKNDSQVEVISGLSEGEEIVRVYDEKIKEGMSEEEIKALNQQENSSSENEKKQENGGMKNDSFGGFNQGVPSGEFRGERPIGGGPMG